MAAYQKTATVSRRETLGEDIFRLTLQAPEIARHAQPGQFVMVKTVAGSDPLLRRPFSIHQITDDDQVQILFKALGKGTRLLAGVAVGQSLDVVGPLGRGFSPPATSHVCLVGGGMGIAPLFFWASHLLRSGRPMEILALLGARTREELASLASDMAQLGLSVRSATDDGSLGHHGLVVDLLADLGPEPGGSVYACGPYPMMHAVARQCMASGRPCQVSLETMMACGLAACLGCAVPSKAGAGYLHVCKEGPVFAAEDVAWP